MSDARARRYVPLAQATGELNALVSAEIPRSTILAGVVLSCVLGVCITFFSLNLQSVLTATACTVLCVANKALTMGLDMMFTRKEPVMFHAVVGISMLIGSTLGLRVWTVRSFSEPETFPNKLGACIFFDPRAPVPSVVSFPASCLAHKHCLAPRQRGLVAV